MWHTVNTLSGFESLPPGMRINRQIMLLSGRVITCRDLIHKNTPLGKLPVLRRVTIIFTQIHNTCTESALCAPVLLRRKHPLPYGCLFSISPPENATPITFLIFPDFCIDGIVSVCFLSGVNFSTDIPLTLIYTGYPARICSTGRITYWRTGIC